MGFIITDLAEPQKMLSVNFWNWHPTVELIRRLDVIDAETVELMHQQCVGAKVSVAEARQIAKGLQEGILERLRDGERVRLNLSITSEPDDGVMYYGEEAEKNYSATYGWLTQFAQFCLECRGFEVL